MKNHSANRIARVIVIAVSAAAGFGTAPVLLSTAASAPVVSASAAGSLASGNTPWGKPNPGNLSPHTSIPGNTPWG